MENKTSPIILKMFLLVAVFILLFGGVAIYTAYQNKQLRTELNAVQKELKDCKNGQ